MKNTITRCSYFLVALVCVLVCSVGCKKNVDIDNSSSEPAKIVEPVVSQAENTFSVEETVSEPEVSAPVETASEVQQAQNTTTTSKKQTSSKANTQKQQTQAQQPTQPVQQPQQSGPAWDGNIHHEDPTWTCPNPSAHPGITAEYCKNSLYHGHIVKAKQEEQERANTAAQQGAAKWGMTVDEWKVWTQSHCNRCGRPFGDGHNGTCYGYFEDSTQRWTCHNYD